MSDTMKAILAGVVEMKRYVEECWSVEAIGKWLGRNKQDGILWDSGELKGNVWEAHNKKTLHGKEKWNIDMERQV